MNREIDIALGFDGRYAPHVAASIASIIRCSVGAPIRFIILCTDVSIHLREKIQNLARNSRFIWIDVKEDDLPSFSDRGHFNRTTLFRLGLEKLAPADSRRVLYLDSDIIVLNDIRELWNVDLGAYPIGAIVDAYVNPVAFAERWQLSPASNYFNAGVLLINLDRVRIEGTFSATIDFLQRHGQDLAFNDQDALNCVFWNRWRPLDIIWNVQRHMVISSLEKDLSVDKRLNGRYPALVHYTGPEKPWLPKGYHPWAWLYWKNLAQTPFASEVANSNNMNFYRRIRLWQRWLRQRPSQIGAWH